MTYKKTLLTILLIVEALLMVSAQNPELTNGKVTYVTSTAVYVRFASTEHVSIKDTLFLLKDGKELPVLIVQNKSSVSTICRRLSSVQLLNGDVIISKALISPSKAKSVNPTTGKQKSRERIDGSATLASYATQSSLGGSRRRDMARFSLRVDHINDSDFGLETYLNYRRNNTSSESRSVQNREFFNIYSLAVKYEKDSSFRISLGRKINRKTASLGPIDGLQFEKQIGKQYAGIIAGFRPDLSNHSFNPNLFQYGGYLGSNFTLPGFSSTSTLGFLEQQNAGQTDRRYFYFQHTSTLLEKLTFFSSSELDVYSPQLDSLTTGTRLTNFYTMIRYRHSRKWNVGLSYDSRRRILYYETFRSRIEDLLADDLARQGLRFKVNFRPFKQVTSGVSLARRFQRDQLNQSFNINGFISISRIPAINGRISVHANRNRSRYLTSFIYSVRHTRTLIPRKLFADLYFRDITYQYLERNSNLRQQYYGISLLAHLGKNLRAQLMGEIGHREQEKNYRINLRLTKRIR